MTVDRLRPGLILERPVRPRGRCSRRLAAPCVCFRPRAHVGPCACSCETYGAVHGAIAVPGSVRGALVTDQPWAFNAPLRRGAVGIKERE